MLVKFSYTKALALVIYIGTTKLQTKEMMNFLIFVH